MMESLGFKVSTSSFLILDLQAESDTGYFVRGKVCVSSLSCTWNIAGSSANCSTITKSLVFSTVLIMPCRIGVFSYNLFPSKEFSSNAAYLRAGHF